MHDTDKKSLRRIIKDVGKTKSGDYKVYFVSGGSETISSEQIKGKTLPYPGGLLVSCRHRCQGSDGMCIKPRGRGCQCQGQFYSVYKCDFVIKPDKTLKSIKINAISFVNSPQPVYRITYGASNDKFMTVAADKILSHTDIVPGKYIIPCGVVCTNRIGICTSHKKRKAPVPCAQQFFYLSKAPMARHEYKSKPYKQPKNIKINTVSFVNSPQPKYHITYGPKNDRLLTLRPDEILSNVEITPGKYVVPCSLICTNHGGMCTSYKKCKDSVPCAQQFFYIYKKAQFQRKAKGK